ncbi:hypothetical protein A6R68_11158, partial [Neotoma lepida]
RDHFEVYIINSLASAMPQLHKYLISSCGADHSAFHGSEKAEHIFRQHELRHSYCCSNLLRAFILRIPESVVLFRSGDYVAAGEIQTQKPPSKQSSSQKVQHSDQGDFTKSSPSSPEPASLPAEDISANSNSSKPVEVILDDDREDLFAEATEEVSLDSPEREPILSSEPSPAVTPVTPTALIAPRLESKSISAPVIFDRSREETSLSMFSKSEFSVKRRFSDFLGLHSKLASKYLHVGYIVPPAPEKSIVGMTKVKVGKEDSSSTEFVEKRRAALERYLQRTVKHPTLLQDPDLRQFLESSELPRAVNTQALSGAGILRMVNKAADAVNKMTIKMNESDAWFEEKQQQFENLDQQLRKLHASVEALVCHRKELSANTAAFAKSAAMLGNSEDHTALSRALSQLAEVEEKIDQLHQEQAFADFYMFSELLSDYIRLIAAVKLYAIHLQGVFDHRMKCWQKWEDAQITLLKKRETEAKMMVANKPDKIQQAKNEIREKERVKDFKSVIIKYLESLVQTQQQFPRGSGMSGG